jgi:hypothetical protein
MGGSCTNSRDLVVSRAQIGPATLGLAKILEWQ